MVFLNYNNHTEFMKQILIFLALAFPFMPASAQMPKWTIPPTNDSLYVKLDNKLIQGKADGVSTLFTMDGGTQVFQTPHIILPFKNNVAMIMSDKNRIMGFIDEKGSFTTLPELEIEYGNPYFENNHLLAHDKDGQCFYNIDGTRANFPPVIKAYPFHRGYAPFINSVQPDKPKDLCYGYYKADTKPMSYTLTVNGTQKEIEPKTIQFLSGIAPDGRGVAVIKNKLYWFNSESETFEPLLWGNADSEKKRHLNLNGDYEHYFTNLPEDSITIDAKFDKNQSAKLIFNKELLPLVFRFGDDILTFEEPKDQPVDYNSDLSQYGTVPYGLSLSSDKILPGQFDEVGLMYGNRAFVKKGGKWGVIEIVPDLKYTLTLNKGEDVAFRHQKFETQIRLDLPNAISAKEARVDIPEDTGCVLDKTSRETKDTESGNFVTYNCVLNIPAALPDTTTSIVYSPVRISYDGIELFELPIKINAWHLKSYNVDPIDSETTISNGVASFTFNINAQRMSGESDYPFVVNIEAESADVSLEKISETRYKCTVSNLQDGNNELNILVTEKGCPPSVFPFEVNYTKPVPKKKTQEAVVVRKRPAAPRLEI